MKRSNLPLATKNEAAARMTPKESLWEFVGINEDPAYKWVLLAFGLLTVVNILSYFAGTSDLSFLKASKFQPWGAVTSIGLYDSWESTVALPLLALLWLVSNTRIASAERKRRSMVLIIGSAYAAVLANIVWLFSRSQFVFAMGTSGFEVAAGGIMLVFSVTNLSSLRFRQVPNFIQLRGSDTGKMRRLLAFIYVTLVTMLALTWITLIELSGASINTEVHVVSSTMGIGLAATYGFLSARMVSSPALGLPESQHLQTLRNAFKATIACADDPPTTPFLEAQGAPSSPVFIPAKGGEETISRL
jgi:hypothetical protein